MSSSLISATETLSTRVSLIVRSEIPCAVREMLLVALRRFV